MAPRAGVTRSELVRCRRTSRCSATEQWGCRCQVSCRGSAVPGSLARSELLPQRPAPGLRRQVRRHRSAGHSSFDDGCAAAAGLTRGRRRQVRGPLLRGARTRDSAERAAAARGTGGGCTERAVRREVWAAASSEWPRSRACSCDAGCELAALLSERLRRRRPAQGARCRAERRSGAGRAGSRDVRCSVAVLSPETSREATTDLGPERVACAQPRRGAGSLWRRARLRPGG